MAQKDKEELASTLSEREKFCLMAYLQTNNAQLAYLCSRPKASKAKEENLASLVSRWINSKAVQAFLEIERERKFISLSADADGKDIRSRDDVIRELNILASGVNDEKRKSDILMKLADLEGMKNKEAKDEESKITYYAQIKCSQCPMYLKSKAELETKTQK